MFLKKTCLHLVAIVEECTTSESCETFIQNTQCIDNVCSCTFALRVNQGRLVCKKR